MDLITLTRSFSLYFLLKGSPGLHKSGHPSTDDGVAIILVHNPTTSHACFQASDLELRLGVNDDWEQKRLFGQLLHSKTIAFLDTLSPGSKYEMTDSLSSIGQAPTNGSVKKMGLFVGVNEAVCGVISVAAAGALDGLAVVGAIDGRAVGDADGVAVGAEELVGTTVGVVEGVAVGGAEGHEATAQKGSLDRKGVDG